MFVVLLLLLSFDELEGAAINVLGPEIRRTFHISSGTIVFIATASSAFFVLGAVPMGWLADRVQAGADRRVGEPRVRRCSCSAPGLAISAFMLFWTRFATGIAKANSIPVHQSLHRRQLPDRHPGPDVGGHEHGRRTASGWSSPVLCAAIATWAGGIEGWRWAWFLLGIPVVIVAVLAFFMKEPPRGQFEKQDVLGEVIEDEQPAPISMEAAFARIKRIRTIRTVLVGVLRPRASGCSASRALESLYLNNTLHVHERARTRGLILSLSGILALPILPFVGRYFDKQVPARTRPRRSRWSARSSCRRPCSRRSSSACRAPPGSGS